MRNGTNWVQQAYLKASNSEVGDDFGCSVSMSGDTAVIGALNEDRNATGINANPGGNGGGNSGAAYVFTGLGISPRLAIAPDGSGGYFLCFNGTPDVTYRLLRASSITSPWDTLATLTAPASGLLEFHDTTAPAGQAFYRTAQP